MLYSPSEPSSIRMTSMSRDIPRRPTGLESQDMLQSSDLNLPISREPPTNTPILNEPFEESSEILPVPALQSSNLSATYTRSVPINKRNIFDSIDDSQVSLKVSALTELYSWTRAKDMEWLFRPH